MDKQPKAQRSGSTLFSLHLSKSNLTEVCSVATKGTGLSWGELGHCTSNSGRENLAK